MNKYDEYPVPAIADLLEQLCPEGVTEVMLGDISEIKSGSSVSKKYIAANPGDFPVINSGKEPLGFVDSFNSKNPIGVTTRGANVGYVSWTNTPHFKGNLNYDISVNATLVNARFLFFQLKNRSEGIHALCTYGGIPALNQSALKTLTVDLPPLEVQEQIVGVLEVFTDLEASLNRELELRETQIEVCLGDIFASDEIANSHSVPLGHLLRHIQPGKYQVNSTEYDPSAPTPVLSPGKAFLLGYTDETDGIFEASPDDPAIIFDDFTTNFHWVDFPFKVKSSAMKMLVPRSDDFVFRYAYWAMKTIPYKPTEHQRQWLQTYSRFEIPLPPLDVQERIVDTLDMFTDYTDNLRREIDLRRQQLEYYRGQLLTFPVAE